MSPCAAVTRRKSSSASSSFSASPSAGARPCARCSGKTSPSACPASPAATLVELFVPCTFDLNVAITKYAYGLEDGELPVSLLFSGTVFHQGRVGLQVMQIPWSSEARYRLPLRVWKQMMDTFYPDGAWLYLRREAFDSLYDYKTRHGIPTWEQLFERFLAGAAEVKS